MLFSSDVFFFWGDYVFAFGLLLLVCLLFFPPQKISLFSTHSCFRIPCVLLGVSLSTCHFPIHLSVDCRHHKQWCWRNAWHGRRLRQTDVQPHLVCVAGDCGGSAHRSHRLLPLRPQRTIRHGGLRESVRDSNWCQRHLLRPGLPVRMRRRLLQEQSGPVRDWRRVRLLLHGWPGIIEFLLHAMLNYLTPAESRTVGLTSKRGVQNIEENPRT